jgi:hypothetical protein
MNNQSNYIYFYLLICITLYVIYLYIIAMLNKVIVYRGGKDEAQKIMRYLQKKNCNKS